jgi:hypothetical protein
VPGDPSPAQAQQPQRDRGSGRRDVERGIPEHIRSDNGPEFVAQDLRKWLAASGTNTLYIETGSPWENGYCERFNSKLRDEFLNGDIFYTLKVVQVLAERRRVYYNTKRPHSSLGYRPPAPTASRADTKMGKSGKQRTLTTFPHARLRRDNYPTRRATLMEHTSTEEISCPLVFRRAHYTAKVSNTAASLGLGRPHDSGYSSRGSGQR